MQEKVMIERLATFATMIIIRQSSSEKQIARADTMHKACCRRLLELNGRHRPKKSDVSSNERLHQARMKRWEAMLAKIQASGGIDRNTLKAWAAETWGIKEKTANAYISKLLSKQKISVIDGQVMIFSQIE